MLPILTAAETQALDKASEARGISVTTLMERAGHAVARAAAALVGGASGRRVVVVCGKGNNGGDGLVAARYLARWGARVEVFVLADPSSGAPSMMLDRLRLAGVTARSFDEPAARRALSRADVAVDAIFGTGFRGTTEGSHGQAISVLNQSGVPVVAVDVPSGVEGDTGGVRGPAVVADVTVTFGAPKAGDVLFPGAGHTGVLEVADIGFPPDLLRGEVLMVEAADIRSLLPARDPDTHKRRSGVVLVVAGSRMMTGAPRLIAEGAYRTGAGLVTVAVPEAALPAVQAELTEPTFLALPGTTTGSVAEAAWEEIAGRLEAFDAVALGPGLTAEGETPAFVRRVVEGSPIPIVIDADGINAFAGRPGELAQRAAGAVITPHAGEFARLFGMPVEELLDDRVGFVRKAAAETGCVVALKGTRTLIAAPDGEVRVNPTGSSVLATGGTGDVLTGAIAALVARKVDPFDAATVAGYVHGLAGRIAGSRTGEGTMAGDVARALPEAVRRVREGG